MPRPPVHRAVLVAATTLVLVAGCTSAPGGTDGSSTAPDGSPDPLTALDRRQDYAERAALKPGEG